MESCPDVSQENMASSECGGLELWGQPSYSLSHREDSSPLGGKYNKTVALFDIHPKSVIIFRWSVGSIS